MIDQYNRQQVATGVLAAVLAILAYIITFFVLAFVFRIFVTAIGYDEISVRYHKMAAILGLVLITVAGIVQARRGQGHYGYEDSAMRVEIEPVTGGAFMTGFYANRVAVFGYVMSQLFLAGPLQVMKAIGCFKQRIVDEPGLGAQLLALQAEVESKPKRHSIDIYSGREREVLLLARMGRIAFSPRKGTVFKKE